MVSYFGSYYSKSSTTTGYDNVEFLLFMELAKNSLDKELKIRILENNSKPYEEKEIIKFLC